MKLKDLKVGDFVTYYAAHPSDRTARLMNYSATVHAIEVLGALVRLRTSTHPQGVCLLAEQNCTLEVKPEVCDRPLAWKERPTRGRTRCID